MNKYICIKHPKYKGKRIPKRECSDCLLYYFVMNSAIRIPTAPPGFSFKDKSKYTRKKKHKKLEN